MERKKTKKELVKIPSEDEKGGVQEGTVGKTVPSLAYQKCKSTLSDSFWSTVLTAHMACLDNPN